MVAYGSVGRSALRAVRDARRKGIPVEFFRPITLWPFPDSELAKMALGARTIIAAAAYRNSVNAHLVYNIHIKSMYFTEAF